MVGTAFTMRTMAMREDVREAIVEGRMDNLQARAFDAIGAGQVLVCGAEGVTETALLGEIICTSFQVRGVAGVVATAACPMVLRSARWIFPSFVWGTRLCRSPRTATWSSSRCRSAGVPIMPGDVTVGDANGVVCIPRDKAAEVAEVAAERELLETFVVERVRGGAPLAGTYPPDEATRRAYREWLSARRSAARD